METKYNLERCIQMDNLNGEKNLSLESINRLELSFSIKKDRLFLKKPS